MARVAPEGPVYQAGTLSGNPVAMAAGMAALQEMLKPEVIEELEARTEALAEGVKKIIAQRSEPLSVVHLGSMFGVFFRPSPPKNFEEAARADLEKFKRFFHAMLRRGVYLAPSAFETAFLSTAHSYQDIDQTLAAFAKSLDQT